MLAPCGDLASFFTADDMYSKQLCDISGLVLTRNQGDPARAFNVTHDIDENLEVLARSRSHSWWEISDSGSAEEDRSEEAAGKYERLMCQIWHQALVVLTHLPFLFRAAEDRRFEYSRVSCLAGCRALIGRWMTFRKFHGKTICSDTLDFQAFTATVTLLLALLGPATTATLDHRAKERQDDLQLVDTVVQVFEHLENSGAGAQLVNQSISAISTLEDVVRNGHHLPGTLRLEIQHFGTVLVSHGKSVCTVEGERIVGPNPSCPGDAVESATNLQAPPMSSTSSAMNLSSNGYNHEPLVDGWTQNTMLQFMSSQAPAFNTMPTDNMMNWPMQESDVMLFDNLLDGSIDGGWNWSV